MIDPARLRVLIVLCLALSGVLVAGTSSTAGTDDALVTRVRAELRTFTGWLEEHDVKGYIGEVGWPDDAMGDEDQWNELAGAWFREADAAGLWVTVWATGEWWGSDYKLAVYEDRNPLAGVDSHNTQASVLEKHPSHAGVLRGVNVAGGEFAAPDLDPTTTGSRPSRSRPDTAEPTGPTRRSSKATIITSGPPPSARAKAAKGATVAVME